MFKWAVSVKTIIRAINVFKRHRNALKLRYIIKRYPFATKLEALGTESLLEHEVFTSFNFFWGRSDQTI